MMKSKKKLSVKWILGVIIGLGILIYLLPREIEQLLGLPQTSDSVNVPVQSNDSSGHPKVIKKILSGQAAGTQQSNGPSGIDLMDQGGLKSSVAQVSNGMVGSGQSTGDQNNQPEGIKPQVTTLNQIPMDDQATAGIDISNQQFQDLQKAMLDRNTKIEQTHGAVMAAGVDAKNANVSDNSSGSTNDQSQADVVGSQEWIMTHRFVVRSGGPSK